MLELESTYGYQQNVICVLLWPILQTLLACCFRAHVSFLLVVFLHCESLPGLLRHVADKCTYCSQWCDFYICASDMAV